MILIFIILCLIILILSVYLLFRLKKSDYRILNKETVTPLNIIPDYNKTIFISIASYRDDQCPNTINSIFENAANPQNVFLGICQQNAEEDPDCFDQKYSDNIRIIRLKDTEAKGPTFARYHCSKLYQNEDYFMQIDSHTKFVKDWDKILLEMIQSIPSVNDKNIPDDKAVLSNYPNDWKTFEDNGDDIPVFCKMHFEEDILKPSADLLSPTNEFIRVPAVSGGFFFTKGSFLKDVEYDPDLPHLFAGEEILFTIRLWTHGYNFYAPNKRVVYHYYERKEAPKYWDNQEYQKWQPVSFKKVEYLLGLQKDYHNKLPLEPSSNFGKERTVDDYYNWIGFDKKTKKFNRKFC